MPHLGATSNGDRATALILKGDDTINRSPANLVKRGAACIIAICAATRGCNANASATEQTSGLTLREFIAIATATSTAANQLAPGVKARDTIRAQTLAALNPIKRRTQKWSRGPQD
ncbi:hypothetical protein KSC_007060 [Ktedonobacter sp. SOSP1-52]|uniref:hypothetical protein n=1 Tax=Ktedonobacter sp. SOSP1-52 TaxID=2778366 RepID=UPI001915B638|nr:hypothetical protein [Ktedonobacter sp. SOSP1-52]GHO61814.1 hypothetical protein KSC_007060 [Ktedonobacter sp. SOSP1-52]